MADDHEEPPVEIFLLCLECHRLRSFKIRRSATSLDIKEAVGRLEPLNGTIWLVRFPSARLSIAKFTSVR